MKKTILTLIITLIFIINFAQDQLNAPKIISTIPSFGDCNVDPELNEIIIKFDQDMANTWSFINTPNYPENNGQPKWIDKRTISFPVACSNLREVSRLSVATSVYNFSSSAILLAICFSTAFLLCRPRRWFCL